MLKSKQSKLLKTRKLSQHSNQRRLNQHKRKLNQQLQQIMLYKLQKKSLKEEPKKKKRKPAPVVTNDGGGRQDVVEKAKGLVGLKYVWGSASISNGGFDCSGLISYVYGLGRQDTRSLWSSVQKSAHLKQNQETLSSYKAHIERAYLTLEFTLVAVK